MTPSGDGSFTYTTTPTARSWSTPTARSPTPPPPASPVAPTRSATRSATASTTAPRPASPSPSPPPRARGTTAAAPAAAAANDDSSGDVSDPTPQAEDDDYTIGPDQTLLTPIGQGVLANDSDPQGLTLTAILDQNATARHALAPGRRPVLLHPRPGLRRHRQLHLRGHRRHLHQRPGHGDDHRDAGRRGARWPAAWASRAPARPPRTAMGPSAATPAASAPAPALPTTSTRPSTARVCRHRASTPPGSTAPAHSSPASSAPTPRHRTQLSAVVRVIRPILLRPASTRASTATTDSTVRMGMASWVRPLWLWLSYGLATGVWRLVLTHSVRRHDLELRRLLATVMRVRQRDHHHRHPERRGHHRGFQRWQWSASYSEQLGTERVGLEQLLSRAATPRALHEVVSHGARPAATTHHRHVGAGLVQRRRRGRARRRQRLEHLVVHRRRCRHRVLDREPGGRLVRCILIRQPGQQHFRQWHREPVDLRRLVDPTSRRGRLRRRIRPIPSPRTGPMSRTPTRGPISGPSTVRGATRSPQRRTTPRRAPAPPTTAPSRSPSISSPPTAIADGSTSTWDNDPSDPVDEINTTHTDLGTVTLSTGLQGSDTFAMQATDPSTGDTSWDNGSEVYGQGQSVSATFNDNAWSDSIPRATRRIASRARPTTAAAPTRSPRATRSRTTTDGARPTRRRGTSTPAPGRRTTD